jgi:toxin ParE1/3/4
MNKTIIITVKANQDLEEHFDYISQTNTDAALRFFDATRQTFTNLAKMSGMGRLYPVSNPRLSGIRKWSVKGFDNYLIFYMSTEYTIEIIRILHSSRDIDRIFEAD